jgi:hypothetical protein
MNNCGSLTQHFINLIVLGEIFHSLLSSLWVQVRPDQVRCTKLTEIILGFYAVEFIGSWFFSDLTFLGDYLRKYAAIYTCLTFTCVRYC